MIRMRLLAKALARQRRGESALGLEACLASTSVDLEPGDFVSDAIAGGIIDFLRGKSFRYVASGTVKVPCDATLESVLRPNGSASRRGLRADCGSPARLPGMPGEEARIWSALGVAQTLKAQHARERAEAKAQAAKEGSVVVICTRPGEISPATWRKALTFAAEQLLPALFVVLPTPRRKGNNASAAKNGAMSAVAHRCGVPGMAADADDAVALYRVAQEAIGRARIGGGAALMECVPFVLEGTQRRTQAPADAIAGLEQYMLGRGIATRQWMEREARWCAGRIAK
ncbi:MAG: thiamine pyrophosphate-dependent enzyme [Bryobacteraceae bacterium]